MLSQADTRKLQNEVKYPKFGTDLNAAVHNMTDSEKHRLAKVVAQQAESIDEAISMIVNGNATTEETTTAKTTKTIKDFKSRRQLNNYLRQHGFTWWKEDLDDGQYGFGEAGWKWTLSNEAGKEFTVEQALTVINKK